MKLDSKYFDKIRSKAVKSDSQQSTAPKCARTDCQETGKYPAPKGRNREGEYFHFCLKHVRDYNRSYNYFNGMNDEEIMEYLEHGVIGHRPTWAMNMHMGKAEAEGQKRTGWSQHTFNDSFDFFPHEKQSEKQNNSKKRSIRNMERKCLLTLNLDIDATSEQIKARYKELVKRHHPDVNGGDRTSEDKLREIITAYNYLKEAGFC